MSKTRELFSNLSVVLFMARICPITPSPPSPVLYLKISVGKSSFLAQTKVVAASGWNILAFIRHIGRQIERDNAGKSDEQEKSQPNLFLTSEMQVPTLDWP